MGCTVVRPPGQRQPSEASRTIAAVEDRAAAAASEVAGRVLDDLETLLDRMSEAYRRQEPGYAVLSPEAMHDEVMPTSRRVVSSFLRSVSDGSDTVADTVIDFRRMARRRLDIGVQLEPLLHVFRVASLELWDSLVEAVEPGEEIALAYLGGRWMAYVDRVSSLVAAAYLDAAQEQVRSLEARRSAVFEAVLAVTDEAETTALAATHGVRLAERYRPIVVGGPAAVPIDRVMLAAPEGTLAGYRAGAVALLVPAEANPDDAAGPEHEEPHGGGHDPAGRLASSFPHSTVSAGRLAPPGPQLAAALARAERVLGVAVASGRVGVVDEGALLVELAATADPQLGDVLRSRVLDRLRAGDRSGHIESTLRAWIATGSVPATARAEFIHENTVAYRFRRVTELCGLDPRRPADAAVLHLALAADAARPRPPILAGEEPGPASS